MRFFPLIATLFLFILFCNLIGLIPGSYTVTSQIVVTAVFACVVYGLSLMMGFLLAWREISRDSRAARHAGLVAAADGADRVDQPIGATAFRLAVRLFANMTAGHVILGVLFGLADQWRSLDWLVAVCVYDCHVWFGSRYCIYPSLHFYGA